MSTISVASTYLESLPGEEFLSRSLQMPVRFMLGQKLVKHGKLVLYKRVHYYLQITLQSVKLSKETFEIPIPFRVEEYLSEGLMYFDYRLSSLAGIDKNLFDRLKETKIKNTSPSQYYDRILEIQTGS